VTMDWDELVKRTVTNVGAKAAKIATPSCYRETAEEPFETALVEELCAGLPPAKVARREYTRPKIPDFPGLGDYDLLVSGAGAEPPFDLVLEFKKWGSPGVQGGAPPKRKETLWDLLKVVCSIAAERALRGYLVVLAPDETWGLDHPFARLFDAPAEWATRRLCKADPGAMTYFGPRHYGVTRVPESIAVRWVMSVPTRHRCHADPWTLKAAAVEPRGPMGVLLPISPPPRLAGHP
jgi:hypothetical protein